MAGSWRTSVRRLGGWLAVLIVTGCARSGSETAAAPAPPPAPAPAAPAPPPPVDEWFGGYLQNQKVGYSHVSSRAIQRDGQTLLEYTTADHYVFNILGQPTEQIIGAVTVCDLDYRPLHADFTLRSQNRDTAVSADFGPTSITCRRTSGPTTTEQTVPIPPGAKIVADERALLTQESAQPGTAVELYQFNPLTLALDRHTLTVLRKEPLALPGETIEATVIQLESPYFNSLVWVDGDGRMQQLKMPLANGELLFRRETREQALADAGSDGSPRVDLVVATGIQPDRPIPDARRANRLVLRVKGLDRLKHLPRDEWQQVSAAEGEWRTLTVTADPPTPARKPSAAELKPYLEPGTYIESDAPAMVAKAKELMAQEPAPKTALAKAERVHRFVHSHIRWQSNIGLFRSALEILQDPAGVCRDSAALYTALARAAGVPTRICAGLVYVDGKFLGHAWAESWDGARWVPFDATTPAAFVDATHLKLSQGASYTAMFEMLPALGNLEMQVVEVGHRAE